MNRSNFFVMRILMFISSYFPLYLILLLLNLDMFNSISKIQDIVKFKDIKESTFIIIIFLFLALSIRTVLDLKKTKGTEDHTFKAIEKTDDVIISYMMTYIVPLLSGDFLERETLIINILLFILVGFMYIRLNLVYLNPLWLLFGYSMYRVDNDLVIITNIQYSELKTFEGERLKGKLIGGNIYLIQRSDNRL